MRRCKDPALAASSFALILALACFSVPSHAAGQTPGYTLTYFNAPVERAPILHPPTLGLAVGSGVLHQAVMDTGSTGVVISASSIRDLETLPVLGEGALTYSSSGRVMQGKYVRTAVTIIGANGVTVTTRPIPVLAVERVDCLATARHCQAELNPRGIAMLGIGFARERDRQTDGTPDKNPFLNLPEMGTGERPGALGRGYIVRRQAVEVGLPRGTQLDGFARIPLTPNGADWSAPPACIQLADRAPPTCGTFLMDTGVATMYLSVPPQQSDGLELVDAHGHPILVDGTLVTILPQPGNGAPSYHFVMGDAEDPLVPEEVVLVGNGRNPPFVNITVRALNLFDYAYDADAGRVGLRPLKPRP